MGFFDACGGVVGVGSIASDNTRGREREAWGPYLFGIKKCRGNEMQRCRDCREEACCGEGWVCRKLRVLA